MQGLKNLVFDFLKTHQFDLSIMIQLMATELEQQTVSLVCQLAGNFTGIFGQNSQQLQILISQLQHCNRLT